MSNEPTVESVLRAFREAVRLAASGSPLHEVIDGFGEFGELQEGSLEECEAASVYPQAGPGWELVFSIRSLSKEDGTVRPAMGPVTRLQLVFHPGRVRLADLQAVFGSWYRDPPEPDKCSFAEAYFDSSRILKDATFFLAATFEAYSDALHPDSVACSLSMTYRDDRYETNRPW